MSRKKLFGNKLRRLMDVGFGRAELIDVVMEFTT
jgi:hypothetical protein